VRKLAEHLAAKLGDAPAPSPARATPSETRAIRAVELVDRGETEALQHAIPEGDRAAAIIGYACRFPGAPDAESFWDCLSSGRGAVSTVPVERWSAADPRAAGASRWGGFVAGADRFDAVFFRMTPREAKWIDPQQRLFLEVAWHALEHAGYAIDGSRPRPVGVFAGSTHVTFADVLARSTTLKDSAFPGGMGNSNAFIPNRVSFFCNFRGPSVLVDTMCSSSLVALHQARRSLERGECELAIAGGVNLHFSPGHYVNMGRIGAHSPDGTCRPFDHRANGFVSAEGVAAVILKPLGRALRDGDTIHGIIRGSAVNHDGVSNGITAPNSDAQADLVLQALADGGLSAEDISYVEAHGTGTELGDPIEVEGLTRAFRKHTDRREYCVLGSAKSNIGHAEAAAGMAGLIKVLFALRHRTIPGTLHFEKANPKIDFRSSPFVVMRDSIAWCAEGPLRAGISSFGMGGANAHVIVEEPPHARPARLRPNGPGLFTLSAQTPAALRSLVTAYAKHLRKAGGITFQDVCHTSRVGRAHHRYRIAIVCNSTLDLTRKLEALEESSAPVDGAWQGEARERLSSVMLRERSPASLAARYVDGSIDLADLATPEPSGARRVPLPLYPFERARCWPDGETAAPPAAPKPLPVRIHPLLGKRVGT
jgi:acyl transferase domain-containing protein